MSAPGDAVTAGYERAEEFLAAIGMTGVDVTDIVIARDGDEGQRKSFTVAIKAVTVLWARCWG